MFKLYVISSGELAFLRCFMTQMDTSTNNASTYSVATASIPDFALSASLPTSSVSWLIDSGASHHMTSMSYLFSTYTISSG